MIIKNWNGSEVILDFQGSFGSLQIEIDSNEIYDISTKIYYGKTTSGKTEIKYKTYGKAKLQQELEELQLKIKA